MNENRLELHRIFVPYEKKEGRTDDEKLSYLDELWRRDERPADGCRWDELLTAKRVIITAEAGAGKTVECQMRQRLLFKAGEPAFFVELASLAQQEIRRCLGPSEEKKRLDAWLTNGTATATFFLDSFDELKLTQGSFTTALSKLAEIIEDRDVRLVITSRPIPFEERTFRDYFPCPDEKLWRHVVLHPLDRERVRALAEHEGVKDPARFIEEIDRRNAWEFTRRPLDVTQLCADWNKHEAIRKHAEGIKENIRVKLEPRTDPKRREKSRLSERKALKGARTLALAALLTRKLTIRHSAEAGCEGDPVLSEDLLTTWTVEARHTLLERALFGPAAYGRVRFHHRSVIEYLAAEKLHRLRRKRGLPIGTLKDLLFADERSVKPSLRPTAAWLALRDEAIFDELVKREPQVLISEGDPESLTVANRRHVLREYVERFRHGNFWRHHFRGGRLQRFAHPELGETVRELWGPGIENPEVRYLCLRLMFLGPMTECAEIAKAHALNPQNNADERRYALLALKAMGRKEDLKEIGEGLRAYPEAWPDEAARLALPVLWPDDMTDETFFNVLERLPYKDFEQLTDHLSDLIQQAPFTAQRAEALRQILTDRITQNITYEKYGGFSCDKKRHMNLLDALCARLLQQTSVTREVLHSTALVVNLRHFNNSYNKSLAREVINSLSPENRMIFFHETYSLLEPYITKDHECNGYIWHFFKQSETSDLEWLRSVIIDPAFPEYFRQIALKIALKQTPLERFNELRECAKGNPDFLEMIQQREDGLRRPAEAPNEDPEIREITEIQEKYTSEVNEFIDDVKARCNELFRDDFFGTAFKILRLKNKFAYNIFLWDRDNLEETFGPEITDALWLKLKEYWRGQCPVHIVFSLRDVYGLCLAYEAIRAEADDPDWVKNLTPDEATLALRYVLSPLRPGVAYSTDAYFPLAPFAEHHPHAMEALLGEGHQVALSIILNTDRSRLAPFGAMLAARMHPWWSLRESRSYDLEALTRLITFQLEHDEEQENIKAVLRAAAEEEEPADDQSANVRLRVWLHVAPDDPSPIEAYLTQHPEHAEEFFSSFSGFSPQRRLPLLPMDSIPNATLWTLVRLAFHHIRPEDDRVREVVYRLDRHDYALEGRDLLWNIALNAKITPPETKEQRASLLEKMANQPEFIRQKDYLLERAIEVKSRFSIEEVKQLLNKGVRAPKNTDEMFQLLKDRLDDLENELTRDESPRELWAEITKEKLMRREIARFLRENARGIYTVSQEEVTGKEYRTDIRLIVGDLEAVIELKIGDKDYYDDVKKKLTEEVLRDQLVEKYLQPEHRRAGCLLITVGKADRTWKHPDANETLTPQTLQAYLQNEADDPQKDGGRRLLVRVLDLSKCASGR